MGSVIVITSGKGGTGKTSLAGGIGAALASRGRRVLCLDADVGLRNLDIALGMADAALMDFSDVMAGWTGRWRPTRGSTACTCSRPP